MMTREDLIAFEADIAAEFNAAKIRAPIHLDGGNEDELIDVFEDISQNDWVLCSWRSHYKALLHGIPPAKVKAEIMAGRSIALCFPEHRFLSSAIVGGHLPIALGLAWSLKRNDAIQAHERRVFCFLGDMAARGGMFHECTSYAQKQNLPIKFIVENNGKSVCTDTVKVWGMEAPEIWHGQHHYDYELPWPHSGAGKRVEF